MSGFTHFDKTDKQTNWSAYRYHEEDPIVFHDGVRFLWRVGDLVDPVKYPQSPKCMVEFGNHTAGDPQPSVVTSYAWVYTF